VFEFVDKCCMEIRKTWTRSICFSIENHVHIVNVLRWLRGIGICKSLGKGMIIVGMLLFFLFFYLVLKRCTCPLVPRRNGNCFGFFQATTNKRKINQAW